MESPNDISLKLKEIYPQHNLVQAAVNLVLRNHVALRLQFSPSPFSSGTTLARLRGTIEVIYHNNLYNIPILVWLPSEFPSIPPIAMVEPTPQMEIQVSSSINADGYFCHPYLQNWTSHARPSLLEVMHIMRHTFGKTPPLLTRASNPIRNESIVDPPLQSHLSQGAKATAHLASTSHLFQVSKPPNLSLTSLPPTSGSLLDSDKPIGDISQLQYKLYLKLRQASDQFNLKNSKTRKQIEYDNQLLNRNANKTRFCMSQLTQIKAQCHSNIDILQRAIAELNVTNETLSALPNAGISCIQFDKNPLTKQLVNLIAEDNSFEDTYYHLGRALSSQVIDLRTYLRSVRSLAHDQFMVRALILKIKSQLFIP